MGWSRTKRMRSLLVAFMLAVVLVTAGSWVFHSLVIRLALSNSEPQQVRFIYLCV